MKRFIGSALVAATFAFATNVSASIDSLLDKKAEVTGFGQIAYREPVAGNTGPTFVLFHGIYGGASHLSWREILPYLDNAGAQVFLMDLPGVGQSDSPKRSYNAATVEDFVANFTTEIVKRPATLVGQATTATFVLSASKKIPQLVRRVVLLSPTGINTLKNPPSAREQALFARLYNDEPALDQFYQNLLSEDSLKFFLPLGYYDQTLVNEELFNEFRRARGFQDQKWISLSFVAGQLFKSFDEAAKGVWYPVLSIFGAEAVGVGYGGNAPVDREADFRAVRADFDYLTIPSCGSSVAREKPEIVAQTLISFSQED